MADGFLRSFILRGFSQIEMRSFFGIGESRYKNIKLSDPTKEVSKQFNRLNKLSAHDLENIRY